MKAGQHPGQVLASVAEPDFRGLVKRGPVMLEESAIPQVSERRNCVSSKTGTTTSLQGNELPHCLRTHLVKQEVMDDRNLRSLELGERLQLILGLQFEVLILCYIKSAQKLPAKQNEAEHHRSVETHKNQNQHKNQERLHPHPTGVNTSRYQYDQGWQVPQSDVSQCLLLPQARTGIHHESYRHRAARANLRAG